MGTDKEMADGPAYADENVDHVVVKPADPQGELRPVHPHVISKVLAIVYRAIETHLIHKAGLTRAKAEIGTPPARLAHAHPASTLQISATHPARTA